MADDTRGKAKHVGGRIREEAGEFLGDRKMARKGRMQQHEGEAEQDAARAEEQLEDAHQRKAAARRAQRD
ncbi:MAG: CsbD family protein [Longimicrobiales bacterium]